MKLAKAKSEKGFSKSIVLLAIFLSIALVGFGPFKQTSLELYAKLKQKSQVLSKEKDRLEKYARARLSPQALKKLFRQKLGGDDEAESGKQSKGSKEQKLNLGKLLERL